LLLKPIVYKLFRGEGPEQDLAMAGHSKGARYVPWFIRLLVFFAVFFFTITGRYAIFVRGNKKVRSMNFMPYFIWDCLPKFEENRKKPKPT
jgi:hypothetical protein